LTVGKTNGKYLIMKEKTEKKRLAILRLLYNEDKPLGSPEITERLLAMGYEISERTVRFHLLAMDKSGFTENLGRNGRQITERGKKELATARIFEIPCSQN
jgi:repressor of nif and glnA expression